MNQHASPANPDGTTRLILIAITVCFLLLGGFYIWVNRSQPEAEVSTPAPFIPTVVQPEAQPEVPMPFDTAPTEEIPVLAGNSLRPIIAAPATIEGSDAAVKLAVADLAPGMAAWIVSDQQIRKWVLAIDVMAEGDVPKQYRPLSYPLVRFEPEVRGTEPDQQYLMKAENFKRTDLLVNLLVAIDVNHVVQYYRAWLPLFEKAYQEQGKKDRFDQRLRAALQRVIDVRPLTATPVLKKRGGVIYVYADEKLEAASDVEKMLWRMGPENSLKLQNYLKQLQQRLPK